MTTTTEYPSATAKAKFVRVSASKARRVIDLVRGKSVAEALDMITEYVRPGVTTGEIDDRIREFTLDHGALPACLGYKG